ncbi:OmpA family protein [Oceaniradius stylonematis]|uniref:OmpA family protein n=1 Tax=Oceaniradius stylonematis TaxID=2184161 RepID=UPI003C7E856C
MTKRWMKATTAIGLCTMIGGGMAGTAHAQQDAARSLADCVIEERDNCPPATEAEVGAAAQIVADVTGVEPSEAEQRVRAALGGQAQAGESPAAEVPAETEGEAAVQVEEPAADAAVDPVPQAETQADVAATDGEQAIEEAVAEPDAEAPIQTETSAQTDAETPAAQVPPTDELDQAMEAVEDGEAAGQEIVEDAVPAPATETIVESETETPSDAAAGMEPQVGAAPETETPAASDALDAAMEEAAGETPGDDAAAPVQAESEADAVIETEPGAEQTETTQADDALAEDAPAETETGADASPAAAADAEANPVDEAARAERRAERRQSQMASEALQATEPDAGASGAAETDADVQTQTVTEQTARTSDQDAAPETVDQSTDELLRTILGVGAGVAIGMLIDDADRVVERRGDRVVIERDGELVVLRDENQLLRRPGTQVRTRTFDDGSTRTVVIRENGERIVTVRAADGVILYRARVFPDGQRIVLIDERDAQPVDLATIPLPSRRPVVIEYRDAVDPNAVRQVFAEDEPVIDRTFSLQQVRDLRELRQLMPRIDLDAINFETGSAAIPPSEARELTALGRAMADLIADDPDEIFLIEGHTDTVGGAAYNLALSDRRAESVALALTEYFDVPPENMITQGYGERYLKVAREGDVAENRRAAVRRITPLIRRAGAQ